MRITPLAPATAHVLAAPVPSTDAPATVPPRPRPGGPTTDAQRLRSSVAFTAIIVDEMATAVDYLQQRGLEAAGRWAAFADQNFDTIRTFAEQTPSMVAAGVPALAFAGSTAAYELALDSSAGRGADTFVARAASITEQAERIGSLVQSIIDVGA